MYNRQYTFIIVFVLYLFVFSFSNNLITFAQDSVDDERIIERYKLMLSRKPKEGSTFDRLYQFYLEGAGLEAMVADYQAEVEANPNDPNFQLILGHIHKRLGKDVDAVTSYQRAVELAPNNYYPHYVLGQFYAVLLQHEVAINSLKQSASLAEKTQDATPEDLSDIYKALGRAYFRRDRVDEAISAWQKIAELDPQNIFARTELADLFIEQELYEQAIAQHQVIIQLKTDDPYRRCLSRREIGNIYQAKGEYQSAIQSYDTALELTVPGNWLRKDLQHRIIGIYAADSDWRGLINYYQQKLEGTPNEPELLGLLAAAYIENQQIEDGIKVYRNGLELAPTDTNLRQSLIAALRNAEKFAEAAAEYEVLSEQDPDDFGIYRELGELYLQLKDEDKARETYQRMMDRDPDNASTHLILAEIYTSNEWTEDAITAYQQALTLAPNNLDYIEYFGEFYLRQGSKDKAIETWEKMVDSHLGTADNYDRLAKLLSAKNFNTEAIAASRKAVELIPDSFEYRKVLAERLTKNGDFDEALKEFTEAAKLAPNTFFTEEMDDQRIELYRRQGTLVEKIEQVETELEKSGVTDTDIFAQQKRLAKMYLKLGNVTYALEVLLKAKALKPNDVTVNRWLAEVYTKQNRRDDANSVYTHLIQVDRANAREYYTNIAESYLNVMDFGAATAAAKQVIAHSPRNPEGHQILAEIAKQSLEYDSAIDSLKQAIRLRSDAIDIRSELAAIYKLAEKPRQALAQYWRCWELCDSVNDKLSFVKPLSETYYDLGRGGEFQEKLKQLSKSNPTDIASVLALAELYRMEGDLPSARFQLARALDRQREDPDLLLQLVSISHDLGENQDALSYQERLVKAHPDQSHQRRLGELLFDAGREQEAIQVWTKLLHAKNQTLEAEVKLAILLIRHGHLNEALLVLDRAADKITGIDAHLPLFQIGNVLVSMNEYDRAQTHFQRILDLPTPPDQANKTNPSSASSRVNTDKFYLARSLLYDIQDQSYRGRNGQEWKPRSFEEAQAGALVHLVIMSQNQGKLREFIQEYETVLKNNPKDIKTLEILAQIYTLTENTEKTDDIIDQLIAVSPNDTTYHSIRFTKAIQKGLSAETLEKYLNNIPQLTKETRLRYTMQYIQKLYRGGHKSEAEKLISELEGIKVMDLNTVLTLIETLVLMKKTDAAERIINQIPIPTQTQQSKYRSIYNRVTDAYLNLEQYEKAIDLFWTYCEKTQPQFTNTRRMASLSTSSFSTSSSSLQTIFPSRTMYYQGSRFGYLSYFSRQLWLKNQHEVLYTKLQTAFDASEGRDRIFSGLALSYCYWWNGEREKSQNVLVSLQKEFPHDHSLKLSTVFISIQTGQHAGTIKLLEELAVTDPRNRSQYFDLTLQLALQTGNTVAVRDLIVKLLNTPSSARELYNVSQQLQNAGYTQYATAIMNKTMDLAMGVRDPNFLMSVSDLLEDLGRGQDAAQIAQRSLRFANQRDRYGRMLSSRNLQQATHLTSQTKSLQEQEAQLIQAAQKNPTSYRAQLNLASYYRGKDQIDKASTAFKDALSLKPKDTTTRKRYADMLHGSAKYDEAIPQYTKLLNDNPNILGYNTYNVIETFLKARKIDELVTLAKKMVMPSIGRDYSNELARDVASELRDIDKHEAAIEIYQKLIEAQPSETYYHRYMAGAYADLGQHEKAIQILRNLLKIGDEYSQKTTISLLTRYYKLYGGLDEFINEYEKKLVEHPTDRNLRYIVAAMKIAANDLIGADELTFQLLDEEEYNTSQLHDLAEAYRLVGLRERELHILQSIVRKYGGSWTTYYRLGMIYALNGETEKAQDAYRKMGRLRLQGRNDFIEYMNIASIFLHNQMWDEAEPLFTEIVNDLSISSHYRRDAEQELVAIKKRREDYSNTTQLKDKIRDMDIGTLRTLAKDFARRGDRRKALLVYTHLEKVMPEDFQSRAQLAELYNTQQQFDNAVTIWEDLLKEDLGNTKFQDGLVRTYQKAGKIDKALEIAQQYIDRDPDNAINYGRQARLYADEGRIDEAIAIYNKVIELTPGNVNRYRELAQLYIRKDDKDSAKKTYQEALRYTGQEYARERIQREILKLSEKQGKLEETMQKAEDEGTLTYDMQKERAKTFRDDEKFTEASAAYEKALDMTSDDYERDRIYEELLRIYPIIGKDDAAIKMYDELAFKPYVSNAKELARNRLINAYKNVKKLDILISIYRTKIENDPKNTDDLEILAIIYNHASQHGKASEMYQALCKIQPDNVLNYYNAAGQYNKNGQSELAEEILKKGESILLISPQKSSSSALQELGNICYEAKLYGAAIKFADAAIAESVYTRLYGIGSPAESSYKLLAKSLLAAKRYEEAVYAYQQVENMAGSSWDRNDARKAIETASRLGNLYDLQIPKLLNKVQDKPEDPEVRLTLAQTYEKANKLNDAIKHYETLSQLQPDNVQWQKKLGSLYLNLPPERHETGGVVKSTALTLNGNGSYAEIDPSEALNDMTQQVTVSAWIHPTSSPNRYVRIVFRSDEQEPDNRKRSYILVIRDDGKLKITSSPNGEWYASLYSEPGLIKLNKWTHIAGVIDAKNDYMKIFIDGYQVGHRNFQGKDNFYQCHLPLRIGATHVINEVKQSSFIGQIDEVRIWNIARTENEIRSDMNIQLKGDEPGLVAYWKFEGETDEVVHDTSPNKNHGRLIGDAKLTPYTRPIYESMKDPHLTKAAKAYQKAIQLDPSSYELYRSLAETYTKGNRVSEVEAVYLSALDAPLTQSNQDDAIQAIWDSYANNQDHAKGIAILEELTQKIENSARLYALLGDAYINEGDTIKAENANTIWLELRKREVNQQGNAGAYNDFARELLNKEMALRTALQYAKRAVQNSNSSDYNLTLGYAYLVNGQNGEAFEQFKKGLVNLDNGTSQRKFFSWISEYGNKIKDKEGYVEMINELVAAISGNKNIQLSLSLLLADYCQKHNMPEKAREYIQNTGFITENAWFYLGPFDNTNADGLNNEFITENITQIDFNAQYNGKDGQISWQEFNDNEFNGYIQLGEGLNWCVAYAFTTVTSPDEREVQFRFDSDDQGKVWLNGEEVLVNRRTYAAQMDRLTVPVTLQEGENSVLVKVCEQSGGWGFYLRITDGNGNPFNDLQFHFPQQTDGIKPD